MAKSSFVSRLGILLVLCCLAAIPAFSADPNSATASTTDAAVKAVNGDTSSDLLEVLLAKGILSQQEYSSLNQRVLAAKAEMQDNAAAAQIPQKIVTYTDKGVGIHAGRFDVTIAGELNGFFYHGRGVGSHTGANSPSSTAVLSGLLPDYLTFIVSTQEKGWDMSAVFSICPSLSNVIENNVGTATASSNPTALGISGIDFRQHYFTFGKKNVGTFKVGRDIGFYGDVLLSDFFLLGTGYSASAARPTNVTLGHIGTGYNYPDFIPQISYTSPSFKGLQGSFAVMTPYNNVPATGDDVVAMTGNTQPQFQAKLAYTAPGKSPIKFKLWSDMITQKLAAGAGGANGYAAGQGPRATGVDYGIKIPFKGFEGLAYGYNSWGIGVVGDFYYGLGLNSAGLATTRYGNGYFFQGTYTFAKKYTVGANYGLSRLKPASGDGCTGQGCFLYQDANLGAQARYKMNRWINLVADYSHYRVDYFSSRSETADEFGLGTIVFF